MYQEGTLSSIESTMHAAAGVSSSEPCLRRSNHSSCAAASAAEAWLEGHCSSHSNLGESSQMTFGCALLAPLAPISSNLDESSGLAPLARSARSVRFKPQRVI